MQPVKIAILLSTFNGERWLPELIQSLLRQSLPFELIWRDDGSKDATKGLVRGADWHQLTEVQHSEPGCNMGACASFGLLMEAALESEAELFFFADQDDIWQSDKLSCIADVFRQTNHSGPQLVHHDLRVVNQLGHEIASSLWRFMRLDVNQIEISRLLTRNSVTGCATAANRALLKIAAPLPVTALMHDWWLGLMASAVGQIHIEPARLVDYRQHDGNALGAKAYLLGLNAFRDWVSTWKRGNAEYRALFGQAAALLNRLRVKAGVSPQKLATLESFVSMPSMSLIDRCLVANRLGLRDRSNILWLVVMLRVAFIRV